MRPTIFSFGTANGERRAANGVGSRNKPDFNNCLSSDRKTFPFAVRRSPFAGCIRVKNFAITAGIFIGLVLFSSSCNRNCPGGTDINSCTTTVAEPGIYMATYEDTEGNEQTTEIAVAASGEVNLTLCIKDCTKIIGAPIFLAPAGNRRPNCSQGRASVETLPNDGLFHDVSILADDPDGDSVGIRIDRINQDEPTSALFEGDRCPDAQITSPSAFRLRGERSPVGNGRVYFIYYTASDGNGGLCEGIAKVCVPIETGGGCAESIAPPKDSGIDSTDSLCPDGVRNADLSLAVVASPEPAILRDILKYEITLSNSGPSEATSVLATFPLPAGVNYIEELSSPICFQSGGLVACDLGRADKEIIRFDIFVRPTATGQITSVFTVDANEIDPNTGNNTAVVTTQVNPGADLSVTITDSPDPYKFGNALTYTIFVRNDGPVDAEDVILNDELNNGFFGVDVGQATITTTQGSCTRQPISDRIITCSLGSIASGQQAIVTINANIVNTGAAASSEIVYTVTAETSSTDSDLSNNTAAARTNTPFANLSVNITDSPDPVVQGSELTYNITVRNDGPDTATGVVLTDTLPSSASFVSASASQGSCTRSGAVVTCDLDAIANGSSATVSIIVIPQTTGTIVNQAEAVNNENRSISFSRDSAATLVNAAAPTTDLSVTISDSPDPALINAALTYTVTVTNNGPAGAAGVILTDTLSMFAEVGQINVSQGSFTLSGRIVTCNLGAIAPGSSATLTVVVFPFETGSITNSATVTTNEIDSNPANNSAAASTTVNPQPN